MVSAKTGYHAATIRPAQVRPVATAGPYRSGAGSQPSIPEHSWQTELTQQIFPDTAPVAKNGSATFMPVSPCF
ncbi:hypothetical protein MKFW12EY_26470 [Methylomonas koyamae]|nr:hypothetical protein MKFW12EY_26470 [Methylomonas koyamae]